MNECLHSHGASHWTDIKIDPERISDMLGVQP